MFPVKFIKNTIKYKNKEIIFSPEDRCTCLSVLLEGEINVCKYTSRGNEIVINTISKGESYGIVWVFSNSNYPHYGIAKGDCEIAIIEKKFILELLKNPDVSTMILKQLSNKILNLNESNELLRKTCLKERLALYLFNKYKTEKTLNLILPSKTQIAKELNSVREVVSRNFKKLEKEKVILSLSKNNIKIIDLEILEDYSI